MYRVINYPALPPIIEEESNQVTELPSSLNEPLDPVKLLRGGYIRDFLEKKAEIQKFYAEHEVDEIGRGFVKESLAGIEELPWVGAIPIPNVTNAEITPPYGPFFYHICNELLIHYSMSFDNFYPHVRPSLWLRL